MYNRNRKLHKIRFKDIIKKRNLQVKILINF